MALSGCCFLLAGCTLWGAWNQIRQATKRAKPPTFTEEQKAIFFRDVFKEALVGERPKKGMLLPLVDLMGENNHQANREGDPGGNEQGNADSVTWASMISVETLEDSIKAGKTRLDQLVTTPKKFTSGGYRQAQLELAKLAFYFAIIENYEESEIRFKESAPLARQRFAQTARAARKGDLAAFNEIKERKLDLADLLQGQTLSGTLAKETVENWSHLLTRTDIMRQFEAVYDEGLAPLIAGEEEFQGSQEEIAVYTQQLAVFAHVLKKKGMPDITDEDYLFSVDQILSATGKIQEGIKLNDFSALEKANANIFQACLECHEYYR